MVSNIEKSALKCLDLLIRKNEGKDNQELDLEKSKINSSEYSNIKNLFVSQLSIKDYEFGRHFINSQVFVNYLNEYKDKFQ